MMLLTVMGDVISLGFDVKVWVLMYWYCCDDVINSDGRRDKSRF